MFDLNFFPVLRLLNYFLGALIFFFEFFNKLFVFLCAFLGFLASLLFPQLLSLC